jgi:hypothetical protein
VGAAVDVSRRVERCVEWNVAAPAETDPIFEAFVRGEIDVTEIVPRLKAQLGLR